MVDVDDYPKWRPVAEDTRQALELLGWGVPRCLPGEPEACGGSFAHHALAHLATLKAIVEVRIGHLGDGSQPMVEQIYQHALAQLGAEDPCNQGHMPLHRPGWAEDLEDPLERRLGRELDRLLDGSQAGPLLGPAQRAAIVGCLTLALQDEGGR